MDVKTSFVVLRRTDYGEADRVLEILTPDGKQSVIAKGVRREKSRMAGGVELFSVSEGVIHRRRESNGMGVLASVRLSKFYGEMIVRDFERLEFGYEVLRDVSRRAEGVESGEYYEIVTQVLEGLTKYPLDVVRAWYRLNILRVAGEGLNLWRDANGDKLSPELKYEWDVGALALAPHGQGGIGADEIKMMRLMMSSKLSVCARVVGIEEIWPVVERLTRVNAG